jgi:hypothetical protein
MLLGRYYDCQIFGFIDDYKLTAVSHGEIRTA